MATTVVEPRQNTPSPPSRRRRRSGALFHVVMIPLTLLYVSPMIFVALLSIRSFDDVAGRGLSAWPASFTFDAYAQAWTSGTSRALLNSAVVTVAAVLIALVLASMAAFALSRHRIPFRRVILLVMLAGNLLPPQILLIPVAKITETVGIYDTLTALVIVQVGFGLGFYTFVLHGFMRAIPAEVFEAALIDGARPMRTYVSIVLPLCRPALAALAALAFTWIFNDVIWAMTVLRTESKFPITAALINLQGGFSNKWNITAAGSLIGAIPCAAVFFAFQKHFVSGLMVGTNK